MKKVNSVISLLLIIMVFVHGIFASLLMIGVIEKPNPIPAVICLVLLLIHIILSIKLTVKTVKDAMSSGDKYEVENKMFVIRRLSGVIMVLLLIAHLVFYFGPQIENFTSTPFTVVQLVLLILLVISLIVHIVTNIRPLMVSLGVVSSDAIRAVLCIFVTSALLLMATSSVVFFLK